MKSLANYIIQESLVFENTNGEIITEGFWKKLGSMFGYNTKKVAKTMSNWSDDLKKGFTVGQYIAAKSKNKDVKKAAEEEAKAAEEGDKQLLSYYKEKVSYFLKMIDEADKGMLYVYNNKYSQLAELSKKYNDSEGEELAKKFKKAIDEKWPDGGKEYEKVDQKIEKAGVDDGPNSEENSEKDNTKSEVSKEVTKEATDTIKDNKDLLAPLAKEANVDGKVLRNFVSAKLRKTLDEKISKKGTREAVQKALGEDVILGTCIMVLGALITKDEAKIKAISEQIGSNADELKNKLDKYKKQYK